jgi:hypothetical protein
MLKLRSLSLILFFTFSVKAYSYKVNIYKHECGITTIYVDEKYGIKKADIEKYFDIYDLSVNVSLYCDEEYFVKSKNLKDKDFINKGIWGIENTKADLRIFDNFPINIKELRPVVLFKKRVVEFHIWLQDVMLEFFKTGDINVLRKPYLGVPPSKEILDIIDNIATLQDDIEICHKSCYNFYNAWYNYYYSFVYKAIYNTKLMDEADMQNKWYDFETKYNITSTYEDDGCD